jgi:hypothetical protein
MERKNTNKAKDLAIGKEFIKGVKIIDIDTAIAQYMRESIVPNLEENGKVVKVPLIYGNAERWEGARKNGYLRDQRGRIQIPLIMFKRNSIQRDESLQHFRDGIRMPAVQMYSPRNRYDKFSKMNATTPSYEQYEVAIPAYVTITYEVMIWTSFTEHMNEIVEAYQYATDRYWGSEDGFKFRTRLDSFETQQEVGEGTERIIRTTFTMVVNAYLLAEEFNNKPTVKKSFTPKRVVWGVETDLTGNMFTSPSIYGEYQNVIDFVAIRGSQRAVFVDQYIVKLTNVNLPILPQELVGTFDVDNWFRVYINGDFIPSSDYQYSFDGDLNEITFTFTGIGFPIDEDDEVMITGKFQEL